MKPVNNEIWDQVEEQVWRQVSYQVVDQVEIQVSIQVEVQVSEFLIEFHEDANNPGKMPIS